MRTWMKGLAALALIAVTTTPALAQRPGGGPGGGRGMGMMTGANLVGMPQVQQELKLNDEQASKVQTIAGEVRESMMGLRDQLQNVAQGERMERMRSLMTEINDKAKASLKEVLTPEQMKRLDQIELQVRGAEAFADAKVHEALEVTAEQKSKIEALLADAAAEQREIMQNAQGDFQAAMGKVRELRTQTLGKIKELMSEAQTSKWSEMIGEPFELTFGPPGGGFGGGRGGRPGAN